MTSRPAPPTESLHSSLCVRAAQWLRGSNRCNPVLYGIASTSEVPDAIGWNSDGSIVVECKVSIEDFLREKAKNHCDNRMGDRRYFMCPPDLLNAEYVEKHFPDHGLVSVQGRKIKFLRDAPMRASANHRAEIRYLRYALIHAHSNLLRLGCSVDLAALCQFFGTDGIALPSERPSYTAKPITELFDGTP